MELDRQQKLAEEEAARILQAGARGFAGRKTRDQVDQEIAARQIHAGIAGYSARKQVRNRTAELEVMFKKQEEARNARGLQSLEEREVLEYTLTNDPALAMVPVMPDEIWLEAGERRYVVHAGGPEEGTRLSVYLTLTLTLTLTLIGRHPALGIPGSGAKAADEGHGGWRKRR